MVGILPLGVLRVGKVGGTAYACSNRCDEESTFLQTSWTPSQLRDQRLNVERDCWLCKRQLRTAATLRAGIAYKATSVC